MKMKIGLIQLTSTLDPKINLEKISRYLEKAKREKVSYIFLPECFYSYSASPKERTPYLVAKGNEHYQKLQQLAKDFQVYLLGGSVVYLDEEKVVRNRSLQFSPTGEEMGFYDKIHLFRCDLPEKKIDESLQYTPGKNPLLLKLPLNEGDGEESVHLGLSICFDLRYPQMYQEYRQKNAQIFSVSSAFTVPTGKAHWHTLLKARAIENQCFVIASAQVGKNSKEMETYGHSLVVDPWGRVLLDLQEEEGIGFIDLDLLEIERVRKSVLMS